MHGHVGMLGANYSLMHELSAVGHITGWWCAVVSEGSKAVSQRPQAHLVRRDEGPEAPLRMSQAAAEANHVAVLCCCVTPCDPELHAF
jgi:hypothetical protein